ncbi:MAG: PC4/YdbC family ssDNA-binding protein [Elusimicrobiaceae bacterium]
MLSGGFKVLEEMGVLPATEGSEIRFSIDEYRGHKYASIRKYLKRDSYNGPTRSGITMSKEIVDGVLDALLKLPGEPEAIVEQELGKFAKRPGLSVVARITIYRDSTGIDLREWQEDVSYKGWTKRGIRLPYENVKEIIGFLKKMQGRMVA